MVEMGAFASTNILFGEGARANLHAYNVINGERMGRSSYLANVKFLIADDNAFMRTIIRRILSTLGAQEFREVSDGAEALKIMQTWMPDIVLLDWEMTPFDGIEFTNMVRHAHDNTNTFMPIIMISAHSEYWRIAQARDVGVTEFLVKPISARTLFSRIRNVIENPRPFVNAPGFFGPDRRRHEEAHKDERREHAPDQVEAERIMDQDEINAYFNPELAQEAEMPQYHSDAPIKEPAVGPTKTPDQ